VELERTVIERVLEREGWNVSRAARYLEIPRHKLTYRMEKYGIRRPG
jgi:two-component system NtrC family response regulator